MRHPPNRTRTATSRGGRRGVRLAADPLRIARRCQMSLKGVKTPTEGWSVVLCGSGGGISGRRRVTSAVPGGRHWASSAFHRLTRAREYQKPLSGASGSQRGGRSLGLGGSLDAALLRLAWLLHCSEAARSGSAGRVRQRRRTRAASSPTGGVGASAGASEASPGRSRLHRCACSPPSASASARSRRDAGDAAALASCPRAQEVDVSAPPVWPSTNRVGFVNSVGCVDLADFQGD
jgi:hypothetical protein